MKPTTDGPVILAGDIGGTKTALALFQVQPEGLHLLRDGVYPSASHGTLEEILFEFLDSDPRGNLPAVCLGVAGAVIAGESRTTNLPWHLSETGLADALKAQRVKLLNDLEAMAYGMLFLGPDQMATLQGGGKHLKGNIAVVAAGTGLGEAFLYWDGSAFHPVATEGGHADFAPRDEREIDLLRYLHAKLDGRVSWERVLSGPGFLTLYEFLRDRGEHPEPEWLSQRLQHEPANEVIAELGLTGQDPLCMATVELFVSLYGAEAGNQALKCLAIGGVYLGGGIAPKLLPALRTGGFLRSFSDKGRFKGMLSNVPVAVALEPRAPLLGAAHYAVRLL